MYYPVNGMVYIKDILPLFRKVGHELAAAGCLLHHLTGSKAISNTI